MREFSDTQHDSLLAGLANQRTSVLTLSFLRSRCSQSRTITEVSISFLINYSLAHILHLNGNHSLHPGHFTVYLAVYFIENVICLSKTCLWLWFIIIIFKFRWQGACQVKNIENINVLYHPYIQEFFYDAYPHCFKFYTAATKATLICIIYIWYVY